MNRNEAQQSIGEKRIYNIFIYQKNCVISNNIFRSKFLILFQR